MELRQVVRISLAAALVGAGLLVGAAQAQTGNQTGPATSSTQTPAATTSPSGIDLNNPPSGINPNNLPPGQRRTVSLPLEEQASQADAEFGSMENARGGVRQMLEKAREDRDVTKVMCLNDKLNHIDIAIRSARDSRQALDGAVQRKDADLAGHHFGLISEHGKNVKKLAAEANQCIGKEAGFVGESQTTTTENPNIPPGDEGTEYPDTTVIIPEPPACLSCVF